ncbi:hypothetical protein R1sor_002100 [Riccia sorocarpa]|uniref:Hexosyltransferase n=1 Tax=Riccia sorocarpa TaxID=122646 RepID=A0ABD3GXU5_9MARC
MFRSSGMRNRVPSITAKSSMTSLIMIMVSFLACFYTAGRLWEDAEVRSLLVGLSDKHSVQESGLKSVDESWRMLDCKETQKRLAALEMEVAAARSQGFKLKHPAGDNSTSYKGRLHAVIGIYTSFGNRPRRDSIRKSWMPTGDQLKKLEAEKGVVIRFIVGRSANRGDSWDKLINEENNKTSDFLILENHVEGDGEVARKTKFFLSTAVEHWDADFYVKVDDDVFVNIEMLGQMLATHWDKPRVYVGCMKAGEVFSEPNQRWYEPEWWKFGDEKSYFRHATGQMYGLSRALAQYVAINSAILHEYSNEDVSVGSWMIGLDVDHIDERRLCCSSTSEGLCEKWRYIGEPCIAVYDPECGGLCDSVNRMSAMQARC